MARAGLDWFELRVFRAAKESLVTLAFRFGEPIGVSAAIGRLAVSLLGTGRGRLTVVGFFAPDPRFRQN